MHGGKGKTEQCRAGRTLPKSCKYGWVSANIHACSPAFLALSACSEEAPAHGWDWESSWAVLEEEEVIFNLFLIDI